MPTKMHEMLIGLISRKMNEKGYIIVAYDGSFLKYYNDPVPLPPIIGRHRPDIIGINTFEKIICIGEAKTDNDLKSKRTENQLIDFSTLTKKEKYYRYEIIIGIPYNSKECLIKLLEKLNINLNDRISYLTLPKELVDDE